MHRCSRLCSEKVMLHWFCQPDDVPFQLLHLKYKETALQTYCSSFYGSQMWRLTSPGIAQCSTAWNIGVRRALGLPHRSHRWALGPLMDAPHISVQLERRTAVFLHKMARSPNQVVRSVYDAAYRDARSDVGIGKPLQMSIRAFKRNLLYRSNNVRAWRWQRNCSCCETEWSRLYPIHPHLRRIRSAFSCTKYLTFLFFSLDVDVFFSSLLFSSL